MIAILRVKSKELSDRETIWRKILSAFDLFKCED